ncbi:hypothetical protein PUR_21590 [Paenibacillus sp. URB8-2]|nr:hypothetical protein PUR_21590 [Paenibacillus sp. URB8-2]
MKQIAVHLFGLQGPQFLKLVQRHRKELSEHRSGHTAQQHFLQLVLSELLYGAVDAAYRNLKPVALAALRTSGVPPDAPGVSLGVPGGQDAAVQAAMYRLKSFRRVVPAGNAEQHGADKLQQRGFTRLIGTVQYRESRRKLQFPAVKTAKAADFKPLYSHLTDLLAGSGFQGMDGSLLPVP